MAARIGQDHSARATIFRWSLEASPWVRLSRDAVLLSLCVGLKYLQEAADASGGAIGGRIGPKEIRQRLRCPLPPLFS
jgi:hypothetical protein